MAKTSKHPIVINLTRDKIYFCTPNGTPVFLQLSAASTKDLEVVNQTELENQIKNFVTANSLKPAQLVIVLSSDVYFEKDLTPIPDDKRVVEIQSFTDTVPLSSISSRIFKHLNKDILVAINRNFYDSIRLSLEALGFEVIAVIPDFMLTQIGVKQNISPEACLIIPKHLDFITTNSFLTDDGFGNFAEKKDMFLKRYQVVIAMLCIGFVILAGVVTYTTVLKPIFFHTSSPVAVIQPTPRTPAPEPTLQPTPELTPNLTLQILNASSIPGKAQQLQDKLTDPKFSSIITGNATQSAIKSEISFSPRVTTAIQQKIVSEITSFFGGTISIASNSGLYDVIIVIGKSTP